MELSVWQTWWKRSGFETVRGILMAEWDPIGVADVPEAADEYDSYVGPIGRMLREGDSEQSLSEHLAEVRESRMGLGSAEVEPRDAATAARLRAWFDAQQRENASA